MSKETRTIEFSQKAYYKLSVLLSCIDTEFAFHGCVTHPQKDVYRVEDIFLYPQVVSAVTVDADESRYAEWLASLDDATFNTMRLQGHSHADMACRPSKTDRGLYEELAAQVREGQYYLFIIGNREQEAWAEIREGKEIIPDERILIRVDDDEINKLLDSMDEMITRRTYLKSSVKFDEFFKNGGNDDDRFDEEWGVF